MSNRIAWIDRLRGFCMLLILWFHTEMYYAGYDVTPYAFYVGDALAVFFILSGYLYYRNEGIRVRYKLYGVVRWLLVPYFVFTTFLALPKQLLHESPDDFRSLFLNIVTGHASWFVAALIVAELLFIVILFLFSKKPSLIWISALLALLASALFGNSFSPWYYAQNLWHVNEALMGYFLMTIGYFFHQYEPKLAHLITSNRHQRCQAAPYLFILLFLLCVLSKFLIITTQAQLIFGPIRVSNDALFITDLMIVSTFLVVVFRRQQPCSDMFNRCLQWVGQRSIVYYFIAGGVPFIVSKMLQKAGFSYTSYPQLFVAFLLVCLFATLFVWLIYRYTHIVRRP